MAYATKFRPVSQVAYDPSGQVEGLPAARTFKPVVQTPEFKEARDLSAWQVAEGLGQKVFNSYLGNFGDEVASGIAKYSPVGLVGRGVAASKGMSQDEYEKNIDSAIGKNQELRKEVEDQYPAASFVADVVGFAGNPVFGRTASAVKGSKFLANSPKSLRTGAALAGEGAAIGGITGLGKEGELPERIESGVKDAGTGLLLGTALGVAGKVVQTGANLGGSALKGAGGIIKGAFNGFKELEPIEVIANVLGESGKKLAKKLIDQGNSLVDVPELQGLSRRIVKLGGDEGSLIREEVTSGLINSPERFQDLIRNTFVTPYLSKIQKSINDKIDAGTKLYEAFVNNNNWLINNKEFSSLREIPYIQEVFQRARNEIIRFGGKVPDLNKGVSLKVGDAMKKIMDDDVEKLMEAKDRFLAGKTIEKRQQLLDVLDQVKGYKEARDVYGQALRLREARDAGKELLSLRPWEYEKILERFSKGEEREAVILGLGEEMMPRLGKSPRPADKLLNVADKQRLKAVFSHSPKEYSEFLNALKKDSAKYRTYDKVLGGSQTDMNLASGHQVIDQAFSIVRNLKTGALELLVDPIKAKMSGLTEKNIKGVTELLLSDNITPQQLAEITKKTGLSNQWLLKTREYIKNAKPPRQAIQGAIQEQNP